MAHTCRNVTRIMSNIRHINRFTFQWLEKQNDNKRPQRRQHDNINTLQTFLIILYLVKVVVLRRRDGGWWPTKGADHEKVIIAANCRPQRMPECRQVALIYINAFLLIHTHLQAAHCCSDKLELMVFLMLSYRKRLLQADAHTRKDAMIKGSTTWAKKLIVCGFFFWL